MREVGEERRGRGRGSFEARGGTFVEKKREREEEKTTARDENGDSCPRGETRECHMANEERSEEGGGVHTATGLEGGGGRGRERRGARGREGRHGRRREGRSGREREKRQETGRREGGEQRGGEARERGRAGGRGKRRGEKIMNSRGK